MLIGQAPFYGETEDEIFQAIVNCKYVLPRFLHPAAASIIKQVCVIVIEIEAILPKINVIWRGNQNRQEIFVKRNCFPGIYMKALYDFDFFQQIL